MFGGWRCGGRRLDGFSTAMGLRFSTAYLTYPPRLHKKVTMHVSSLKALRRFESGWRVEGCGGGEAGWLLAEPAV
jgi:hypothetical protein